MYAKHLTPPVAAPVALPRKHAPAMALKRDVTVHPGLSGKAQLEKALGGK